MQTTLLHRLNEAPLRRFWRAATSTWTRTGAEKGQGANGVTLCRWKLGEVTLEINVPSSLWPNCPLSFSLSLFILLPSGPGQFYNKIVVLRKFSTCPRINITDSRLIPTRNFLRERSLESRVEVIQKIWKSTFLLTLWI